MAELTIEERMRLSLEIARKITYELNLVQADLVDLTDIGNTIGLSVGEILYQHYGNEPVISFELIDFASGYTHGYSLADGTHDKIN